MMERLDLTPRPYLYGYVHGSGPTSIFRIVIASSGVSYICVMGWYVFPLTQVTSVIILLTF